MDPTSTVAVAAKTPLYLDNDESHTDDDFERKRKRSRTHSHKIESRGSSGREKLREKQLLIYRISAVETTFLNSSDK